MFQQSNDFFEYNTIIKHLHSADLIEINRGKYRHWTLCEKVENDVVWCFHVTIVPIPNSALPSDAIVCLKYEKLMDILIDNKFQSSKCRINNQIPKAEKIMEENKSANKHDFNHMIQVLHEKKDQIFEYNPNDQNCEHYVTSWKYGIGFSSHSKTYHRAIDIGFGITTGIGATIGLGAAGLTAAGFASTGIAAGSAAAAYQSSVGSVAAGSTFAALQSLGATGTIAAVGSAAFAFTAPAAVAGGIYYYWRSTKPGVCEEYTTNK